MSEGERARRDASTTHPLFPAPIGEGLHGALEFESKLAESPGTLLGLDPGLGLQCGLLR